MPAVQSSFRILTLLQVFPHFGLLPLESTSDTRWNEFWTKIDNLNNEPGSKGKKFYKVFFLGRHGQGISAYWHPLCVRHVVDRER
jgi:hypothetical protein